MKVRETLGEDCFRENHQYRQIGDDGLMHDAYRIVQCISTVKVDNI